MRQRCQDISENAQNCTFVSSNISRYAAQVC